MPILKLILSNQALEETNRRRIKQMTWNKINNIQPKTIKKNIKDLLENIKIEKKKVHIKIKIKETTLNRI